jgi:hypothetical protein
MAGELVEMPPVSGPQLRSPGRRPFQNLRIFGPSAREFRPVDELASPDSYLSLPTVLAEFAPRGAASCKKTMQIPGAAAAAAATLLTTDQCC